MPSPQQWNEIGELIEQLEDIPAHLIPGRIDLLEKERQRDSEVIRLVRLNFRVPTSPMSIRSGTVLDAKYQVEEILGQGGMGVVYRATHLKTEREVALKFIHPSLTGAADQEFFVREIKTLGRLEHRGIVQILDAGSVQLTPGGEPNLFFAMEYIRGVSIVDYCRDMRLPLQERLALIGAVSDSVQFAHDRRVIHCDIKPANIIIRRDGSPVLLDFGVASVTRWLLGSDCSDQSLGIDLGGTPEYMSPQRLADAGHVPAEEDDVYSLGVVLYEMLCGKFPFSLPESERVSRRSLRSKLIEIEKVPLGRRKSELGGDLERLVGTAMAEDPADRYGSVLAFARGVQRVRSSSPGSVGLGVDEPEDTPSAWKPSTGDYVPLTRWKLMQRLGEGAVGEVWLVEHDQLREKRAIKFCLDDSRVRLLKRETTVFRLLKKSSPRSVVGIREVSLEESPQYLMLDYVEGGNLEDYLGREALSESALLNLIADVAEGLQAVHDCGVLHRDLKPSNLLVGQSSGLQPCGLLTDFGVGAVISEADLDRVTRWGFTETLSGSDERLVGTQMYLAPEIFRGERATVRSDIYSMGVVLFQCLVGDFRRPITADWRDSIGDPLLQDDLAMCLAHNPGERFVGAGQLAHRLREIETRRRARQSAEQELRRRERVAYLKGASRVGVSALAVLLILGLSVFFAYQRHLEATLAHARLLRSSGLIGQQMGTLSLLRQNTGWFRPSVEMLSEAASALMVLDLEPLSNSGEELEDEDRHLTLDAGALRAQEEDMIKRYGRSDVGREEESGTDVQRWWLERGKVFAFLTRGDEQVSEFELTLIPTSAPSQLQRIRVPKEVTALAIDSASQRLAIGMIDGGLVCHSTLNGDQLWLRQAEEPSRLIRFSKLLFVAEAQSLVAISAESHNAWIFDARHGELKNKLYHRAPVNDVVVGPKGEQLLTACDDGQVYQWSLADGKKRLYQHSDYQGSVLAVARHPQYAIAASLSEGGYLRMFELESDRSVVSTKLELSRDQGASLSLEFSNSGDQLGLRRGKLLSDAWKVHGPEYSQFRRVSDGLIGVELIHGTGLALSSDSMGIRFVDVGTGVNLGSIELPGLRSAVFRQEPPAILTSLEEGVFLWPLKINHEQRTISVDAPKPQRFSKDPWGLVLSRDEDYLAIVHQHHIHVRRFDLTGELGLAEQIIELGDLHSSSRTLFPEKSSSGSPELWNDEELSRFRLLSSNTRLELLDFDHAIESGELSFLDRDPLVLAGRDGGVTLMSSGRELIFSARGAEQRLLELELPGSGEISEFRVDPSLGLMVSRTARDELVMLDLHSVFSRLVDFGVGLSSWNHREETSNDSTWTIDIASGVLKNPMAEILDRVKEHSLRISSEPSPLEPLLLRGLLYRQISGGATLGEADFRRILESNPKSAGNLHVRALAAYYLGDYDTAIKDLESLRIELEDRNGDFSRRLQYLLLYSRLLAIWRDDPLSLQRAESLAREALELAPESLEASLVQGYCFARLSHFSAAEAILHSHELSERATQSPTYWLFRALAVHGLGRSELSQLYWERGHAVWEQSLNVPSDHPLVTRLSEIVGNRVLEKATDR